MGKDVEVPEGWEEKTFSKLGSVLSGFAFKSKLFSDNRSDFPLIRIRNLLNHSTETFYSGEYQKEYVVENGDILIGMDGEFHTVKWSGDKALLNQRICKVIPDPTLLDHAFSFYTMSKEIPKINHKTASTTVKHLSTKDVKNIKILLPPLPEQKKIASILSSVDEAIVKTKAIIDQTKKLKKGMMQELLTRGIGHTKFKQTEIGEIPESWEVSTIGDACEIRNNLRKPLSAKIRSQMEGPYPYYGPTKQQDSINEYRVEGKHVLIGEDGDHFLKYDDMNWSMTQLVDGQFNVNNHAHIIKGKERCLTEWVHHYFRNRDIVDFLTRQGAGRYKLRKATLLELKIAIPPLSEQKSIIVQLNSVDNKLLIESQRNIRLRASAAFLL